MSARRSDPAGLAAACARILDEKKATGILALDLRKRCDFASFFVLATGRNPRHIHAMGDALREALRAEGERPLGIEGEGSARWVLVDLGPVVVHIFQEEARRFYSLETLWGDAPRIDWGPAAAPTPAPPADGPAA